MYLKYKILSIMYLKYAKYKKYNVLAHTPTPLGMLKTIPADPNPLLPPPTPRLFTRYSRI